jgi:hypothetical protein
MATKAPATIDESYPLSGNDTKTYVQRQAFSLSVFTHDLLLVYFIASIFVLAVHTIYIYNIDSVMDDAFITFRYSENFANGFGLVYNRGEYVEGYTNFLWAFVAPSNNRYDLNTLFACAICAQRISNTIIGRWSANALIRSNGGEREVCVLWNGNSIIRVFSHFVALFFAKPPECCHRRCIIWAFGINKARRCDVLFSRHGLFLY